MKIKLAALLTVICLIINILPVYAVEETSTTAMRMKPMQDKLKTLTAKQVETAYSKYTDLKSHKYRYDIGKMLLLEVVSNKTITVFRPDNNLTVEQFLKMVLVTLGYKIIPGKGAAWAAPYIKAAKEINLIGDNEYSKYTDNITKQQMAKILVNAAMLVEAAPDRSKSSTVMKGVRDYASVGDTYKQSVIDGYLLGIFSNDIMGCFLPKGNLKMGEACSLLVKFLDATKRHPFEIDMYSNAIELPDYYGVMHVMFPEDNNVSQIKTAYALKNSLNKSKGYVKLLYNPKEKTIFCDFYKSEEESGPLMSQGCISICYSDRPYSILTRNSFQSKTLHLDVYDAFFKSIFGSNSDKVMALFKKHLDIDINADTKVYSEKYKFNNRNIWFISGGVGAGITVDITEEGKNFEF